MLRHLINVFIFLLCTVSAAKAQNVLYKHYTVKDGLPSNKIYGIIQDQQGRIWIGTDKGVARFDGKKFKVFTVADGLPTNDVFYFFPDPEGRVWLSDYASFLTYIQNDTVHSYPVQLSVEPNSKLNFTYYKGLVFASHFGLELIIAGSNSVSVVNINDYLKKRIKGYQTMTNYGLNTFTYNGKSFVLHDYVDINYVGWEPPVYKNYKYNPDLDSFPFRTQRFAPTIFCNKYLFSVSKNKKDSFTFFNLQNGSYRFVPLGSGALADGYTNMRNFDAFDDHIQYNTNNGMGIIDTNLKIIDQIHLPANLSHIALNGIYKDRTGNYWIATSNGGIYLISRALKNYSQLVPDETLGQSKIIKLIYTDDRYFLFNEQHELIITDTKFNVISKYALPSIVAYQGDQSKIFLLKDSSYGYYIITSWGYFYLAQNGILHTLTEGASKTRRDFLEDCVTPLKSCIYEPKSRKVLVANHSALFRVWFNGERIVNKHVIYKRCTNILRVTDNEIWTSDDMGNFSIFDSTIRDHREFNLYNTVTNQATDAFQHIIFTLEGKGLYSVKRDLSSIQEVYAGGDIQAVKVDSSNIWLATNNSISQYHYNGKSYRLRASYPNIGGLLYEEVYSISVTDNRIALLCDKGIISIPREEGVIKDDTAFTKSLHLSALRTGKDNIIYLPAQTDSYSLEFRRDNTNFLFSCNSTPYLGAITYQYFLEGKDQDWQSSNEEEVSYPALDPGSYTLHLKAVVQHTGIATGEYKFHLEILPAWWQTWWFRSLLVLLGMGMIAAAVLYIIRRNKNRALQKAEIDKRMAGLELTALQAQMNPHFIFNALSSIQSFINSHDTRGAEELLQKFSMLIRLYLEFSRHQFITLRQELKVLELYTAIERMRFGNRFDVVMRTRGEHADKVLVPPMLVQPLVENAINHGLYHKKEKGLLKVIILIKKDCTIIVVDDDGIGREAARKLRRKLFPSRGNQILKDRIETLQLSGIAEASMKITDKTDKFGNNTGTRVILTLQTHQATTI